MKLNEKIVNITKKVKYETLKHSPEILVVTGIAGIITSTVLACVSTIKVKDKIADSKKEINDIHEKYLKNEQNDNAIDTKSRRKDLFIAYSKAGLKIVKAYAPSAIIGTFSIGCIVSSNKILRKRNIALAAAYTAVDKGFKDYRQNVIKKFGEEVDKELKYNIQTKEVKETVKGEDGKDKKVKKEIKVVDANGYSDYARFFDEGCSNWEKDAEHNLWYLRQQQAYANEKLKRDGYLFLNDVYDMLGIPRTKAGQIVGWLYNDENKNGDNYVDFGIYDLTKEVNRDFVNGYERTILLDFNVDGPIYDKI